MQLIYDKPAMHEANPIEQIRRKFAALDAVLDDRARRQWAAAEAQELGYGGISCVAQATGLGRDTIRAGLHELHHRQEHPDEVVSPRLRKPGAGRKALTTLDPDLLAVPEGLVEPFMRGHHESPLRWTCKSTRTLAKELTGPGHPISDRTVATLLL